MSITINISNYEEFLLSAIDGELNGEEMAALENFMQQHPEIRKELELLESTKLRPEAELKFEDKEMLYRNAGAMSATNYERFLLDYVDNELSVSEKRELEALISQHPHIQKDLSLLQATRLSPDLTVTFGNKASLYRKKERTTVRPLWWWSAAAAVVIGLSVWLIPGRRSEDVPQVAVTQPAANGVNTPAGQSPANTPSLADAGKQGDIAGEVHASDADDANDDGVQGADNEKRDAAIASRTANSNMPGKTSADNAIARRTTDKRVNKASAANVTANTQPQDAALDRMPDSRLPVLANIPQPASTSGEVVQQLQEKTIQQERILAQNAAAVPEKTAVMANAEKMNNPAPAAAVAPANAELVVAVTMNGDSKLLNGVANVARFLSRKKK